MIPTNPAAKREKTSSLLFGLSKICGPTVIPCIKKTPNKTAAIVLPGIPRVSNGIMLGPETALLADSGAAIPSTIPVPHSSDLGERLFSSPYATKHATEEPSPGNIPIKDPTNADLDINGIQRRNSSQVILEDGSWRISLNSFFAEDAKVTYV